MISRMQRPIATWLLLLLVIPARAAENAAESESRLRESVTYLASDALGGRGVGTSGLDQAADYIADQFQRLGLRTDLFHGTPFQEFDIPLPAEMGPAEHNRLTFVPSSATNNARRIELKLAETFNPLAIGGSGNG